jgi:hypothetical protein
MTCISACWLHGCLKIKSGGADEDPEPGGNWLARMFLMKTDHSGEVS